MGPRRDTWGEVGADLRSSLRIVVRRARSDAVVLAATFVTVLLATTLLAASLMYADAVSTSGLRSTLASGAPGEVGVRLVARAPADGAATTADELAASVARHLGPWLRARERIVHSGALALPALPDDHITSLATASGLREQVEVVAGRWPEASAASGGGDPVTVLHADAAALAGLEPGDVAEVELRGAGRARLRLAATYRPRDPSSPYWWDEPLLRDGVTRGASFTTVGPFVVLDGGVAVLGDRDRVTVEVRSWLDPAAVAVSDVRPLRAALAAVRDELEGAAAERASLEGGLNALLVRTERAVTVTRAAVVLTAVQLAVLALYAIVLAAGLLRSTRVVETSLVRSRGAEPAQLLRLAVVEGVLLVVPAIAAAPVLALLALRGFARAGVLGLLEVEVSPVITGGTVGAAAVAGVVCLLALVAPAVQETVTAADARAQAGREDRRPLVQRGGIDLALLAVAVLGMWQLTRYQGPLAEDLHGRLGVDPVLVAAPALGLLAGAVVTLRLVPVAGRLAGRLAARRAGLVPALGAWQLGRRPTRTARSLLLLLLAVAIGTFASSYTGTWLRSQQDQADAIVGADLRVAPDRRPGALPDLALPGAYAGIPGVTSVAPVLDTRASFTAGRRQAQLLALDASAEGALVIRPDATSVPPADMLAQLRSARRELPGIPLGAVERVSFTASVAAEGTLPGPVGVRLLLRDGTGLVHRAFAGNLPPSGEPRDLTVRVGDGAEVAGAVELRLLAVEVTVPVPPQDALVSEPGTVGDPGTERDPSVPVRVTLGELAGDGEAVDLTTVAWRSGVSRLQQARVDPSIRRVTVTTGGVVLELSTGATLQSVTSTVQVTLRPDEVVRPALLPAYATPGLLAASATTVGGTLRLRVEGQEEQLHVLGTIASLPGSPRAVDGVVVDLPSLAANRAIRGEPTVPTSWLVATDGTAPTTRRIAATLAEAPFSSAEVVSRHEVGRDLREDPAALGLIGALALGFVAAAGFAAAGYAVTALVAARERLSEFALLAALGTTRRHVRRWLLLESGVVVGLSLTGGILLGLALARLVLPAVALSRTGEAVVPPPVLVVPWTMLTGVTATAAVILVLVPLALARLVGHVRVAEALRAGDEG